MVLVLSCHPFSSQGVINPSKEPVKCLVSGDWVFVSLIGNVTEVYKIIGSECVLHTAIKNSGFVEEAVFCSKGNYLATLETNESEQIPAVQTYHGILEDKSMDESPKETSFGVTSLPLESVPVCLDCCSVTGNLAVGGNEVVVIFKCDLAETQGPVFTQLLNIHISYLNIRLLNIHENFLAMAADREVHVLYVAGVNERKSINFPQHYKCAMDAILLPSILSEEIYFHRKNEIFELKGPLCIVPRTAILVQRSNKDGSQSECTERIIHLLYKLLPDTKSSLHTLQLIPKYHCQDAPGSCTPEDPQELLTVHCLISNSKEGFLYQLYPWVELHSKYLYISPCSSATIGENFLFAATDQGLATYSQRVNAAFVKQVDCNDLNKKACPEPTMDTCLISNKPFMGLHCLQASQNRVLLMSKVMDDTQRERLSQSENSWNIYILKIADACETFDDIIDFGIHSEEMNPELYLQGLIEGHLLLRSKVIQQKPQFEDERTQELYRTSCRLLGEFYARKSSIDCLLTLPYFKMAGLSLEEVFKFCQSEGKEGSSPQDDEAISKGLLYYLEDAVFQEKACVNASQECLSAVVDIMLKHQPGLCSEILVAPHLQGKFDLEKADQVLVKLRKRVIQGQTYQWKTLDFIAAIKVYLAKGEVEQAMATFDLIYEDELVGLCSRREDLIITKNKEQLTYLAEMMFRFPSAIVSILVNLTESGRLAFKVVCNLLEKRTTESSGNNFVFTQYLEAILASSSDVCKTSHTEALERLAHLYIDQLMSENTSPTPSSKRKPSTTSRSTRLQQKKRSRYSWLDKLPPFEGADNAECMKLPQAMSPTLKNQGLMLRFTLGKSGPKRAGPNSSHLTCNCLDCHSGLVQLQEILSKEGIQAINIHEVMEKCHQVPDEKGRASLELLCLAVSSFEDAVRRCLDRFPSIFCEFAISVTMHSDLDKWKLIVYEAHKKLQGLEDKEGKVYHQCIKDILHHLSSNLSPEDFQNILPDDMGPLISKPYLEKVYKVQKIRTLRADIKSSLEVLVK